MESIRSLVSKARQGDGEAVRQLVNRYEQTVVVTAWLTVGDYHLAQDIAQEAFVAAFRNLQQLKHDQAFGSWLLTTTRRRAQRASERTPRITLGLPAAEIEDLRNGFLDEYLDVMPWLNALPQHERDVVCLRYLSGFSVQQIADHSQKPLGTVTKQLSRALKRLRRQAGRIKQ